MRVYVRKASAKDMEAVYRLTHDAYVAEGYIKPHPDGWLIHYPELDDIPETTVLVASEGKRGRRVVGTVSWTRDGKRGLHVDHDFKAEVDAVRAEGLRLGAAWRIVTTEDCRSKIAVIMALVRAVVHDMISSGMEVALFSFNPKHAGAYARLLNMDVIAERSGVAGLNAAPAVLMRADWHKIPAKFMP